MYLLADMMIYFSERSELYKKSLVYEFVKRLLDIMASLAALILLSPFFVVIIVLIKIDSKGPIFFLQERVGKNGRIFKMYKFRSMIVNAEDLLKELKNLLYFSKIYMYFTKI